MCFSFLRVSIRAATMLIWALAVFFGITLFIVPIFFRLLVILPYILIGLSLPIIGCLIITIYFKLEPFDRKKFQIKRRQKFEFYRKQNWKLNLEILDKAQKPSPEEQDIYSDNFVINDTLNNLISLVIKCFVMNWSQRIFNNDSFTASLQHEFSYIFKNLRDRLGDINYSDLVVLNLIPIFNEHITNLLIAQEITKRKKLVNKSNKIKTDLNDDTILALNYNRGMLHPSLKLNSKSPENDLKSYLSLITDRLLPCLLEESELDSKPLQILAKELVSCCVLKPICDILADPDFYNQIIVDILSKQIKDRNSVRRIRNILRHHSKNISNQPPQAIDLLTYCITPALSSKQFQEIANLVYKSQDMDNILKYKFFILLQKQSLLIGKTKAQVDESKELAKCIKRMDALCYLLDDKLDGQKVDMTLFQSVDSSNYQATPYPDLQIPSISLSDIILTPSRLRFFSFFMQQRGNRQVLLNFWIAAESLKNPLEFNVEHNILSSANVEEDAESSDEDENLFMNKEMSQSQELIMLFEKFFGCSVMKIPPKIYYKVSEYAESDSNGVIAYNRARRNIFKLQAYEYHRMVKTDYIAFQKSDLWIKLLIEELANTQHQKDNLSEAASYDFESNAIVNENTLTNELYGDPLAVYREKEDVANYVDVNMTGKVSDKVVKAVEDALNQIMNDQDKLELTEITEQQDKRSSRLVSDEVADDIFGKENKGLFSDVEDSFDESSRQSPEVTDLNSSANEQLDHNLSDRSEDLSNSMELSPIIPSVLDLSNQIENLAEEIERLNEQKLIINTLLNKAEVINNIPECRILRKSLLSLDKELKLKIMQKEQYMVQEGENSLYQKCKVKITNFITAKDKSGRTFVMYVIKVFRLSTSDPSKGTASWIITRRFSQFYELHQYLKSNYAEVRVVEFPKRNVMVKFIQNALIEKRQKSLERYLQQLIEINDVCADIRFREFLSSEAFSSDQNPGITPNASTESYGPLSNTDVLSTQTLYPLMSLVSKESSDSIEDLEKSLPNISDSSEFENAKVSESSFSKPICDLVILLFQLSRSTNWLRGKGLILLFQQVFGSTIEKTVRSTIDGKIRNEETVSQLLTVLQSKLFPNGQFKKSSTPRTHLEKDTSKQQAKSLLRIFLSDTTAKIFGRTAANEAADIMFLVFQNEILNRHLVLTFIDEIFATMFPEIAQSMR